MKLQIKLGKAFTLIFETWPKPAEKRSSALRYTAIGIAFLAAAVAHGALTGDYEKLGRVVELLGAALTAKLHVN